MGCQNIYGSISVRTLALPLAALSGASPALVLSSITTLTISLLCKRSTSTVKVCIDTQTPIITIGRQLEQLMSPMIQQSLRPSLRKPRPSQTRRMRNTFRRRLSRWLPRTQKLLRQLMVPLSTMLSSNECSSGHRGFPLLWRWSSLSSSRCQCSLRTTCSLVASSRAGWAFRSRGFCWQVASVCEC